MLKKIDDTFRSKLKSLLTISAHEVGASKAITTRLSNSILLFLDNEFYGKKPEEQLGLFMELTDEEIMEREWLRAHYSNGKVCYKILDVARKLYKNEEP